MFTFYSLFFRVWMRRLWRRRESGQGRGGRRRTGGGGEGTTPSGWPGAGRGGPRGRRAAGRSPGWGGAGFSRLPRGDSPGDFGLGSPLAPALSQSREWGAPGPKELGGCLGSGKWGALDSWLEEGAGGGSSDLQDFRVRRRTWRAVGGVGGVGRRGEDVAAGGPPVTSPSLPAEAPASCPALASARSRRLPL